MLSESRMMEILSDWNYWGNYKEEFRERKDYIEKIEELSEGREKTSCY